jgi:hypothetical protein
MKIIQIIVKKDEIYGLCDEGQLWHLNSEGSCFLWILMEIPDFVHPSEVNESFNIIQHNDLKINLTGG